MTRNIVCASYLAIAVMVFLMALLWQTKMEKTRCGSTRNVPESSQRLARHICTFHWWT